MSLVSGKERIMGNIITRQASAESSASGGSQNRNNNQTDESTSPANRDNCLPLFKMTS